MQHFGRVSLEEIARAIGTPVYVHDLDAIGREAEALEASFDRREHLVCYAVKANSAGPILRTLAARGCGADVVSGPELALALRCGIPASKIVFSGVAKTNAELDLAIENRICAIQAESFEEIERIAARGKASIALRINPGVEDIATHEHIATGHDEAKFGIPMEDVPRAVKAATSKLELVGIGSHVGSQLTRTDEYVQSARMVFEVAKTIPNLKFVDTGGGFGIDYGEGCPVRPADFVKATIAAMKGLDQLSLHIEPGRALVAKHVVLLSSVVQVKETNERRWMMIDAGMNDLIRPALYRAFHRIVAIDGKETPKKWRVVGPCCESSDDFGFHELPGDCTRVAILDAGAYGYTMASRYNGRAFPAEAFVANGKIDSVKARKPDEDWIADRL